MTITKETWLSQYSLIGERNLDLLSRAYDTLQGNIVDSPDAPWHPYRCISPWIREITGIWNWDTAFHAMTSSRVDTELAKDCLRGFM